MNEERVFGAFEDVEKTIIKVQESFEMVLPGKSEFEKK